MDISQDLAALVTKVQETCSRHYASDHAILSATLSRIQTAFDAILLSLRQKVNQLAPIHRLPEELLVLIFELAATRAPSSHVFMPDRTSKKSLAPQIIASHVCSRWRLVVLSSRACWSNIELDLSGADPAVISTLISRAGDRPLRFALRADISPPESPWIDFAKHQCALDAIPTHLDRITSLDLSFPDFLSQAILSPFVIPAPRLQFLGLSRRPGAAMTTYMLPRGAFDHCPDLRILHLRGIIPSSWEFQKLVRIYVSQLSLPEGSLSALLKGCPHLEALTLLDVTEEFTAEPITRCSAPFLNELEITSANEGMVFYVLQHLQVKDIVDIHIAGVFSSLVLNAMWKVPTQNDLHLSHTQGFAQVSARSWLVEKNDCSASRFWNALVGTPLRLWDVTSLCWDIEFWVELTNRVSELPLLKTLDVCVSALRLSRYLSSGPHGIRCPALREVAFTLTDDDPDEIDLAGEIQPLVPRLFAAFLNICVPYSGTLQTMRFHFIKFDGMSIEVLEERATLVTMDDGY